MPLNQAGTDITLADAIRVRLPECYIEKATNIDAVRRVAMAVADQVAESLARGGSAVVLSPGLRD